VRLQAPAAVHNLPPEERVDLFTFPPVCLPSQNDSFTGKEGSVYGGTLGLATAAHICSMESIITQIMFL
jgi:hypothetical protein